MEQLQFFSRDDFRNWLQEHCRTSEGVWLLFGKAGGPKTLKANEALEEALCFGWIDGQMKSIDEKIYIKYFSERRKNSKWSEKNKKIVPDLETQGIMTDFGREKIAQAKENGQWDVKKATVTMKDIELVCNVLKEHELAYKNFQEMSPSVKKTYTKAYLDAKTEEGRLKRVTWMVERLNKNLKPM